MKQKRVHDEINAFEKRFRGDFLSKTGSQNYDGSNKSKNCQNPFDEWFDGDYPDEYKPDFSFNPDFSPEYSSKKIGYGGYDSNYGAYESYDDKQQDFTNAEAID